MMHPRFAWVAAWGTFLWLASSAASAAGWFPLTLIEQLFLLAPLIVVPLGLGILHEAREFELFPTWAAWAVLVGGAAVLAAYAFPRGLVSGALAFVWALVTFGAAGFALRRLLRHGAGSLSNVCYVVACVYLPVGGIGLVASRLGMTSLGFEEPIILLTAVHFHNSGFAAPILVGAAAGKFLRPGSRAALRAIAAGVLATPALIAMGFIFSPALKLIACVCLALALTGLALLTLARLRLVTSRLGCLLIGVSAGSILAGMALSTVYAAGEFAGRDWIGIPAMAASHGLLNGVGFVLCGLLGRTIAGSGRLRDQRVIPNPEWKKEEIQCASQLPAGQALSAVIWRDGWSN